MSYQHDIIYLGCIDHNLRIIFTRRFRARYFSLVFTLSLVLMSTHSSKFSNKVFEIIYVKKLIKFPNIYMFSIMILSMHKKFPYLTNQSTMEYHFISKITHPIKKYMGSLFFIKTLKKNVSTESWKNPNPKNQEEEEEVHN